MRKLQVSHTGSCANVFLFHENDTTKPKLILKTKIELMQ